MRFWLEQALADARFGTRALARSPAFTAIALLSIALGIMATTAIYSVVHAVILDPFPYRDVDTLMSVRVSSPEGRGGRIFYTTDQFLDIAARSTIFDGVIASTISDVVWTSEGEPQRLRGNHITAGTFEVMGVPPLLGRSVAASDFAPGAEPVVVLGYRFWQRQFAGDAGVLGRKLRLNGVVRTVIGVMPRRFMWRGADVYVPIVFERGKAIEGVRFVHLLGRLKPGVTPAQADADLRPIIEDLRKQAPGQIPDRFRVSLLSFKETFPSSLRGVLWLLFGAVGLLLAIACANVSNLLLSRGVARQREMALRAALGAGRGRLVRQLLTESLVLALAGGALGVALAWGAMQAIIRIVPPDTIPDESVIAIDTPVIAFSIALTAVAALLFGLVPAFYGARPNLAEPLKQAGRGAGTGVRQAKLRGALVVAEVALSLMLLVAAGLMIRTVMAVARLDLGIRPERVLTLRVPLQSQRYREPANRIAFYQELLDRLQHVPGVLAAGINAGMHPLGGWGMPAEVVGQAQRETRPVAVHQINPEYLRVFGISVLRGRVFTATETATRQHVALCSQAFARRFIPDGEPLGRIVRLSRLKSTPFSLTDDSFQIVGVVKDAVHQVPSTEIGPELYIPFSVTSAADVVGVLTQGSPEALAGVVRREVQAIDKEQPVTNVMTLEKVLDEEVYAEHRFSLLLFSLFAGLGLTLAVIGVYGVISHAVTQRTQEMGVRIALGASFADVIALVVRGGFLLLALGIALGLAGSIAAARFMREQIWNVSPFDPVSFAAAAAVLLAAGLLACLWPARRAARVDPVAALRWE
jgi:putative ABC transport system permease protein